MKIIGSGEIEEVVKGKVYRIRHHLGRDPKTGRYIRSPKKTVYGTKAEARRALEEYRIELECGVKNPEELTVGRYARAWYQKRVNTGRYSPLTLKDDELQVRKIEELWGTTLLENLTLKMISDEYDKLLSSKKATKSTLHKLNATLSLVMDEAVANELVDANPCGYVKAPRPKPKERKALSDEQALELAIALRTEEQTGSTVAVWIALATGMRRGEILGLKWEDIDFETYYDARNASYRADDELRAFDNEAKKLEDTKRQVEIELKLIPGAKIKIGVDWYGKDKIDEIVKITPKRVYFRHYANCLSKDEVIYNFMHSSKAWTFAA